MGILDRFRKKPLDVILTTGKQPDNFYTAILKYKDRPGYSVRYSHKKQPGTLAKHVDDIPISDTLEVAKNIEDFIVSKWGGGHWQVNILDARNKFVCTYQLNIGGTPYNSNTGRKVSPDDPDTENTGGRRRNSPYDDVLAKVMEKALTQDPLAMITQLGTVIAQFSSGSSKMEDLAEQMLITRFNNDVTNSEGDIERVKGIIEIGRMFAPAVPADDALSSVIQAAPALITAMMAMKGGAAPLPGAIQPVQQAPALQQNAGGVDLNALRSLAASIPAEMISQLPADQQQAVRQLLNTPTPEPQAGVSLPRPGDAIDTAGGVPSATSPTATEEPPQAAGQNPHHGAIDNMIEEIRVDIRGESTDRQIAEKMLAMITAARGFTSSEPHPVLKGIMEASEETGEKQFRLFCQAIPELGRDYQRIERIEQEIVNVMQAGAAETRSALESDQVQGDLNFAYDTEAQERDDVSRSTRIPEGGTEASVGSEPDRDVDQTARETEPDQAKAV